MYRLILSLPLIGLCALPAVALSTCPGDMMFETASSSVPPHENALGHHVSTLDWLLADGFLLSQPNAADISMASNDTDTWECHMQIATVQESEIEWAFVEQLESESLLFQEPYIVENCSIDASRFGGVPCQRN